MAKTKQRVIRRESSSVEFPAGPVNAGWTARLRNVALALLGGSLVYVCFHPSDSVLVEQGDALWFGALAIALWTCTFLSEPTARRSDANTQPVATRSLMRRLADPITFDVLLGLLAVWLMMGAFLGTSGSLRDATNEAWLWVAGAATISASRRLLVHLRIQQMMLALLVAVGALLAAHALHQQWISLPETRQAFLEDPDGMMRQAGIAAPPLSSQRMVFASRLFDGGPTATFALANSLAAVLIATCLLAFAITLPRRKSLWTWIAAGATLIAGLAVIATRSRSAVAIVVLGIIALSYQYWRASRAGKQNRTSRLHLLAVTLAILSLPTVLAISFWGDEEFFQAAPASLTFRLRYWKSTILLLLDHPWFGAGPGGFRSLYLGYRLPVANETISDPHNFFFETLAAGGIPAGILLTGLTAVGWLGARSRTMVGEETPNEMDTEVRVKRSQPFSSGPVDEPAADWIAVGGLIALVLVWVLGAFAGSLPDGQAMVIAIPCGVASGTAAFFCLSRDPLNSDASRRLMSITSLVLAAVLLHLSVSGGWTVPGVAAIVWCLIGLLTHVGHRTVTEDFSRGSASSRTRNIVLGAIGIALLLTLRFGSIGPVQEASRALGAADYALRSGLTAKADAESRRAVESDTWNEDAAIWRAEFLKNQLLRRDNAAVRAEWESATQMARTRGGDSPLVLMPLATQRIHLYQRYGKPEDLADAESLLQQALRGSPHDLATGGLLAAVQHESATVIDESAGAKSALELARETKRLSELDDNLVRHLNVLHTPVVEFLGRSSAQTARLASIEMQFKRRFAELYEPEPGSQRRDD
ncbi:MAG: O-antigen ligase family protein [Planctomycetota bacterium]